MRVLRCTACGVARVPPVPRCPACGATSSTGRDAIGRGVVHSHTTVMRAPNARLAAPYTLAIIALEEGPRIMAQVDTRGGPPIEVGEPVSLRFERDGHPPYRFVRTDPAEPAS